MKKVMRYFGTALQSISANKLRAMLTMLGIIIGVAAVLTTTGIGAGAAANITASIESAGTNLLTVSPGASTSGTSGGTTLTMGDAEALNDALLHPNITLAVPEYSASATLIAGTIESSNQVVGTVPDYASVRNKSLLVGRFLSDEEMEPLAQAVVLGYTVAKDLFGLSEAALNQTIRINGTEFQVIGVLEETGGSRFDTSDTQAFVPIGLAQGRLFNAPRYRGDYTVTGISVTSANSEAIEQAELEIEQTLRLLHGLSADEENDFTVSNQASLLDVASSVSETLTILLGSIGGISLLVGGIGIMNIMLVSVTERTREIGLRKALGAHDNDILLQFLIEALVLTSIGGAIGIILSYGVGYLVTQFPSSSITVVINTQAIMLALAVSMASGFIFGLYPAMRATRLDPIEALRYE